MKKIMKAIKNPKLAILYLMAKKPFVYMFSDKSYLKLSFRLVMGKKLDLKNPKTFNEKLQWLKLYDRQPEYTMMVDKYKVREYIKNKIGEQYLIPLIGVWDSPDQIDFDSLPNEFVLKCNHNSGKGMCICTDKSKLDIEKVKSELKKGLKQNYFLPSREWPYKNVPRKIICEKYMVDESGYELKDYKIFCFNGKPEYVEVDFNRFIEHKLNPYDFNWNPLNFCDSSPNDYSANIKRPKSLDEMKALSECLSKDTKFLRVDFYEINGRPFIGELTFYPGSGFIQFNPSEVDFKYGSLLKLSGDINDEK